jgi:hypothetical protein
MDWFKDSKCPKCGEHDGLYVKARDTDTTTYAHGHSLGCRKCGTVFDWKGRLPEFWTLCYDKWDNEIKHEEEWPNVLLGINESRRELSDDELRSLSAMATSELQDRDAAEGKLKVEAPKRKKCSGCGEQFPIEPQSEGFGEEPDAGEECVSCGKTFCNECLFTCDSCEYGMCEECMNVCQFCDGNFCKNCFPVHEERCASEKVEAPGRITEDDPSQFRGLYERTPPQRALGEAIRKGRLPPVGDVRAPSGPLQAGVKLFHRNVTTLAGLALMSAPFIYLALRKFRGGQ